MEERDVFIVSAVRTADTMKTSLSSIVPSQYIVG